MGKSNSGGSDQVSGFQLRDTPLVATTGDSTSTDKVTENSTASSDLDNLGDLPHSYGSDTIFLIAQEPRWLFTYWDIDISRHPGGQAHLRVYVDEGTLESEIEVPFETRNWYIPVKAAGAVYKVEIGYYRGSDWKQIARSASVQTPRDKVSESDHFDYASIPLHLSFQKLTDSLQAAVRSGESLIQALSRLQREGQFSENTPNAFPQLALTQRMILESILGKDLLEELSSGNLSSEQVESRIQNYLQEKLSSGGGASEAFGSELFHAAALSSLGLVSLFSGEHVSSWNLGAVSSWATGALTSWKEAAGAGSSWSAPSSWTSVETSSWGLQTLTSWSEAALSSFGLSAKGSSSSWPQALSSSWLQAAQSSWAGAAGLTSWSEAALASWSQAALSSWGGASESLSSFGEAGDRGFLMNVNAEVIFYGGTDPQAKVTIDGKPIQLSADGTFRYHFVFPNGTYEIPIVATSPDGVETRSAVLRFDRSTQKTGPVDDTAQPPLGAPMGSKI